MCCPILIFFFTFLIQRASKNGRGPDLSRTVEIPFSRTFYLLKLSIQTPGKPEANLLFSSPLHPMLFLRLQVTVSLCMVPNPTSPCITPSSLHTQTHTYKHPLTNELEPSSWQDPLPASVLYAQMFPIGLPACLAGGDRLGQKQFAYCKCDLAQEPCSGIASPRVEG